MKKMKWLLLTASLLLSAQALAAGGDLDLTFNHGEGVNNSVYSTALQVDGQVIIGGAFTSFNGAVCNRIARLRSDGWIDVNFDPGAGTNDSVFSTILQADGKVIIGGAFTSFNGTVRNRIARLNSDGSLDVSFDPGIGASDSVNTIVLQADGKIIIGGAFTSFDGMARNRIARLNSDGTLDVSFDPGAGASGSVNAVDLQADGKVMIGGAFTSFNGTARNNIVRLNSDGTIDVSFDPGTGANGSVNAIDVQTDGKVMVGGAFTSFNATARNRIARLNSSGALDSTFNPGVGANNTVYTTTLQPDGKLIIGGDFTSFNGTARNRIARLNSNGTLDTVFSSDMGANNTVYSTTLQPDGKVIIGGSFTDFNGRARNYIARLPASNGLDIGFNLSVGPNGTVNTINPLPDGKLIIAGGFSFISSIARTAIARLNSDGSLDDSFYPGWYSGGIYATALQPDGKVIVGGGFSTINGTSRNCIARANSDGSLDTTFNPGAGTSAPVISTSLQPDGKVIIGGQFRRVDGTLRDRIARLNSDGSHDTSFNPGAGADDQVYSTVLQPDGKVIVGGSFTSFDGTARNRVARLNSDGSLDTTFNPGAGIVGPSTYVRTIVMQPDGKVIIGGVFASFNGTARNNIARLNSDGSLDVSFDPGTGATGPLGSVESIYLQVDGKVIVGGGFISFNGVARNRIARLNSDGSLDTTFNPGLGANLSVHAIALQPDGKAIIGGGFDTFDGVARLHIARIVMNNDTDNDGTPDLLDIDDDNDGVLDTADVYPLDNTRAGDIDGDGVEGLVDNCPAVANPDQLNTDGDAQGDACDPDDDNDNYSDAVETALGNNPLNAYDPLHVAPGVGYILGMDDRNFGTASFDPAVITGAAWDGAGNFIKTGTMERLHEVVASANTDFCGIGVLGIWCWWWAMDNGVVLNDSMQSVQINGTSYTPFHDQSGYLLYESSPGVWLSAITDAVKISSDNNTHTCVISKTQGVYCWAADSFTDTVASTVPANLKNTSSVSDIAVGGSHACVINSGAVQCWGSNTLGQTAVPVVVSAPQKITSGSNHSCAINGGGRVSCWGDNSMKQKGDKNGDGYVDGVSNALGIAAGDNHTCAITGSYITGSTSVQCWGDNGVKQSTPPRSLTNGSTTPIDVRAAGNQNCAVLAAANIASAASLTCWPAVLK